MELRAESETGRLILAGAPLGNAADASGRLAAALESVPVIAAEDTRRLRRLADQLGVRVTGRVLSFFEGNELARLETLLDALRAGEDVLIVTDAGMPSVSDPGYRLVTAAIEEGITVTTLPGPSAVTAALAISGLPVDRFCFEGFLPRKPGERRRRLTELANEPRTLVFFEAPHRLAASLVDLGAAFGEDRSAVVCREMTKTYEEVKRGALADLAKWAADGVRGEITLVVAGATQTRSAEGLAEAVAEHEAAGASRKEAIAAVARERRLPKKEVYAAVIASIRES